MAEFLREISATARRVVVIHDAFMSYVVQDVATLPNAESYMFNCIPVLHSLSRELNDLESLQSFEELKSIPSSEYCLPPEFLKPSVYFSPQSECFAIPAGTIFSSCRSIEGTFIDLLAKQMKSRNKQIWAVGPLNLDTKSGKTEPNSRHKCLEWLDKQAPKSVLYVSFGTSISMKDEEIKELAIGLEQSKHKFLWLVRHADTGDIFAGDVKTAKLPEGFEERVKQFGLVVRDWAPQVEILGHPSTGGFMNHCGWQSCLESIAMGVPIAAWPMHTDQPRNAFLVTNILKVGLAVTTSEQGEEIVTSSTIASVVKRLMESKEGEEMGKRAAAIAGAVQQAVKEGGVSRLELDSFIAHITR
ncbi:hypothetical protein Vadar_001128 [Vaccinium darrowii]|uniref:Uncharacterized protein n=1 Tax=Vaccinium darrowii TaxID=229202 RepID=A0ACB7XN27_9ERIC|nr:hypothetical protein Vadar_001128 [Vaccinium darrowii]